MRRIGYGLLALMGLGVLVAAVAIVAPWMRALRWERPGTAEARAESVLFEVGSREELRFNLAGHEHWVVLQAFPVADAATRRQGLSVAFDVEIRTGEQAVRQRHHLALPALADARPWAFARGPGGGEVWIYPPLWIDLTGHPGATHLSVRAVEAGAGEGAVLWRAALERGLDAEAARARYRQMGASRREALTRHWVMPPALVAPEQRQDLLRVRRERLAPIGREGVDYRSRRVLLHDQPRRPLTFAPRDWALPIGPAMRIAVELREEREVVLDVRDAEGEPLAVDVSGPSGRVEFARGRWRGTWAAGRYELRATRPGTVDLRDARNGALLLPDGTRTRYSRLERGARLRFRLHGADGTPAPVRLRVRPLGEDVRMRITVLDAADRGLATRTVAVPWRPSLYDRRLAALGEPASIAHGVELQPVAEAHSLEVSADAAVLVAALTTPPVRPGRRPRWFSFLPDGDRGATPIVEEWVVEQPEPPLAARVREGAARRAAAAPPAPRLRLRAEGSDPEGEGGDEE